MYLLMWEFIVPETSRAEFEKIYGISGSWYGLFAGAPGYIGTELLHDEEVPQRYVTIDRWASRAAYEKFKQQNSVEYKALDDRCSRLTLSETLLGSFRDL